MLNGWELWTRHWGWYSEQEWERRHERKEGSEELVAEGVLKREEMGDNMGEVEKIADEGESGELEEEGVLKRGEMRQKMLWG